MGEIQQELEATLREVLENVKSVKDADITREASIVLDKLSEIKKDIDRIHSRLNTLEKVNELRDSD